MIRHIEELALNAWPALQTVYYDGWIMRFSNGFTRRANSVNPLYLSTIDLDTKIGVCEELYFSKSLHTVYKLTTGIFPDNLDSVLAERGYELDAPTIVQLLNLDQLPQAIDQGVTLSTTLTDDWLTEFCRLSSRSSNHKPLIGHLLNNIAASTCYASILDQHETVAMGMAVAEQGYIGLYDIVTAEKHRNQGIATRLVSALLHWGKATAATTAYLQVMADNTPALHLYEKIGFRQSYQYWYRIKRRE